MSELDLDVLERVVGPPEVETAISSLLLDLKTEWLGHFATATCSSEGLAERKRTSARANFG